MVIKYLGKNCFRIRHKKSFIVLGTPKDKTKADIVLLDSLSDKTKVKIEPVKRKEVFFVPGPGEYEVGGVDIWHKENGFWLVHLNGTSAGSDWKIAYLNDWKMPDEKKIDSLGEIDLLLFSIEKGKPAAKQANELVKRVVPKVVIPAINFSGVKEFLDEVDREDLKSQDKAKLKKSGLSEEGFDVYILREQS